MMKKIKSLLITLLFITVQNVYSAPIYKVEVLIFENLVDMGIDGEQWRKLKERPARWNTVPVSAGEGPLKAMSSTALNLSQVRHRLEKSGKYRVLYHEAWSQPVLSKEENTAAWIELPGQVEGSINLYKGRYLHLIADLVFSSYDGEVRLNQHRRLKPKELHYLDHPLFGVLVRVVQL